LTLTEELREEFRKPFGKVYTSVHQIVIPEGKKFVTVGDKVSYNCITAGLKPFLIVFDAKENRDFINSTTRSILDKYADMKLIASNPPGQITEELQKMIKKSLTCKTTCAIFVIGEEDLATLQVLLEYPIGTIVLYGQPSKGIVFVEIEENIKNKCKELQSKMKRGL
jgi:hypothetical protein